MFNFDDLERMERGLRSHTDLQASTNELTKRAEEAREAARRIREQALSTAERGRSLAKMSKLR